MRSLKTLFLILALSVGFLSAVNLYCSNTWRMTASSRNHNLGILANGSLLAWGWNWNGEVALGEKVNMTLNPVIVKPGTQWSYICARHGSSFGIMDDGTLWAFGENNLGNLGDGTKKTRYEPVQIGTDNNWKTLACGFYSTLGLKKDGSLYAWGSNVYGSLGDKSIRGVLAPKAILPGEKWSQISVGEGTGFAIHVNGSLFAWGNNKKGQLGDGNANFERHVPTLISPTIKWKAVSGGHENTFGLDVDGNAYAWGENTFHERQVAPTGSGRSYVDIPTRVFEGLKFDSIVAGINKGYGILTNGTLVGFGENDLGALGIDSVEKKFFPPVEIGAHLAPWKQVSHHRYHTSGINAAGHLFTWGENEYGRLGFGTLENSTLPAVCGGNSVCYSGDCSPSCPEGFKNAHGFCVKESNPTTGETNTTEPIKPVDPPKNETNTTEPTKPIEPTEPVNPPKNETNTTEPTEPVNPPKNETNTTEPHNPANETNTTNTTNSTNTTTNINGTAHGSTPVTPDSSCGGFLCPIPLLLTATGLLVLAIAAALVRRYYMKKNAVDGFYEAENGHQTAFMSV